ncbi:vegetative cell wall protein gp1 [Drosophila hydei]|uniref:Vegetative cell wall protein gp1 n=1 Tax=Drosophila hydei TaxID=7224 RepID=A0A6J1MF03_DROHY|nr:vegetative cell wall protein gp1 [Drosophila hydei]
MKVFALTLLSLAALAQARIDYKLQCTREEVGIRWPSYFSNSEYYVCQGIYGNQLTVHCPPGEVFTFVLQQCASPALYVPAPPMDVLPTDAPITTHVVNEEPPVMAPAGPSHVFNHEPAVVHESEQPHIVHASPLDPTPPTPPTEPPTPPTVAVEAPKPGKKPVAPQPHKKQSPLTAPAKAAAAKKPAAPSPPKAAKKPTPPNKAQKKPSPKA